MSSRASSDPGTAADFVDKIARSALVGDVRPAAGVSAATAAANASGLGHVLPSPPERLQVLPHLNAVELDRLLDRLAGQRQRPAW